MSFATKSRQLKFSIAIVLGLLVSAFPAGLVLADHDPEHSGPLSVPTTAEITGAGAAQPTVLYKWELQNEDRSAQVQTGPWSDNPVMYPILEDDPLAYIGYWWVGTYPGTIDPITGGFVQVYHPDGSLKYQLHGVVKLCEQLDPDTTPAAPLTPGSSLWAAVESGQLTLEQAQEIQHKCLQDQIVVFQVFGEISKHQPCGIYEVRASVTATGGAVHTLVNFMEVGCIVGLEFDQDQVDWGTISAGQKSWVFGDWVFDQNDGMPTVKNTGNVDMYLQLHFSSMFGATFDKEINQFDARLWRTDTTGDFQLYDPITASIPVCFDAVPIGSNVEKKLDLSIMPGNDLPADIYTGTMTLNGWSSPTCSL